MNEDVSKSHIVSFTPSSIKVLYTCKNFEQSERLCFDIRVLHVNSIFSTPKAYLPGRWSKNAEVKLWAKRMNAEYPQEGN